MGSWFGGSESHSSSTTNNATNTFSPTGAVQGGSSVISAGDSFVNITDGGLAAILAQVFDGLGGQLQSIFGDLLYTTGKASDNNTANAAALFKATQNINADALRLAEHSNDTVYDSLKAALSSSDRVTDKFMVLAAGLLDSQGDLVQTSTAEIARAWLNAGEIKSGQLANAQQYLVIGALAIAGIVAIKVFAK
jgi:hypothetical protein